ncbi:hypothetical protein VRB95_00245 [Erwinia aphidicola]
MVKKTRRAGPGGQKVDNFQYAIIARRWQGEIDYFWRESLQKG